MSTATPTFGQIKAQVGCNPPEVAAGPSDRYSCRGAVDGVKQSDEKARMCT